MSTGVLSTVITNNNGQHGIFVDDVATAEASLNVTIVDSVASNNPNVGISVAGAATAVTLRNFVASYNGIGLFAGTNAILRVAHSVVTGNGTGLVTSSGGILNSYGDNDINGNASDGLAALTTIPTH